MKQKNIQSDIKNNETNNNTLPKKEIKDLETRLKTLKQKAQGEQSNNNPYIIPASIIVAGIFIAVALFFSGGGDGKTNNINVAGTGQQAQAPVANSGNSDNVKPVTSEDHIKGNLDAPVKIIEFSDLECPFCKRFHSTLQQVVDEYGDDVVWVYRHFPLDSLHSKARIEASATELAYELGGNDAFWAYLDRLFEITPANNGLQLSQLVQIAEYIGLPTKLFQDLVDENDAQGGKFADHIEENVQDAISSGGRGTPYTVIVAPNGDTFPVSGAQPYSSLKVTIDLALKSK